MEEGGLSDGDKERTITATRNVSYHLHKKTPHMRARAVRLCFGKFYENIEMSIRALMR